MKRENSLVSYLFVDSFSFAFPSFLSSFISFSLSLVRSFSLSQNTLSTPTNPPPPPAPPFSYQAERESGTLWSRVARRVQRPTRMAQHRFLPSFLSQNSRRPNSTLSSAVTLTLSHVQQ